MQLILAAAQKGEFAQKLSDMLWTAYGKPIKFVFWCAVAIVLGGAVIGFLRKLVR